MFAAGRIAEIGMYCMGDVGQLAGIFLRAQHLRGVLTDDGFRLAGESLLTLLASDPRTAMLAADIDRKRFLMLPTEAEAAQ